jgi:hypothetical protein
MIRAKQAGGTAASRGPGLNGALIFILFKDKQSFRPGKQAK